MCCASTGERRGIIRVKTSLRFTQQYLRDYDSYSCHIVVNSSWHDLVLGQRKSYSTCITVTTIWLRCTLRIVVSNWSIIQCTSIHRPN